MEEHTSTRPDSGRGAAAANETPVSYDNEGNPCFEHDQLDDDYGAFIASLPGEWWATVDAGLGAFEVSDLAAHGEAAVEILRRIVERAQRRSVFTIAPAEGRRLFREATVAKLQSSDDYLAAALRADWPVDPEELDEEALDVASLWLIHRDNPAVVDALLAERMPR